VSLMPSVNGPCPYGPPPRGLRQHIRAWAWPDAETAYLDALAGALAGPSWETPT
jgi:hypothetical protein